jgi:hypothetical protein
MARLYAIIIAIVFSALSGFYVYSRPTYMMMHESPLTHHNIESNKISASWIDYLQDCGGEKIIENSVHTKILWNEKYENNIVEWSGYFADVKVRSKGIWFTEVEMNILVKMEPSESTVFADLVLSVENDVYKKNR